MVLPSTPTSVLTSAGLPPPDEELSCALLLQPVAAEMRTAASSAAPAERFPSFTWSSLVLVGLTGHRWSNERCGLCPERTRRPRRGHGRDGGTVWPAPRGRRVRRGSPG